VRLDQKNIWIIIRYIRRVLILEGGKFVHAEKEEEGAGKFQRYCVYRYDAAMLWHHVSLGTVIPHSTSHRHCCRRRCRRHGPRIYRHRPRSTAMTPCDLTYTYRTYLLSIFLLCFIICPTRCCHSRCIFLLRAKIFLLNFYLII